MSKDKREVKLSSSLSIDIVFKHANRRKSESDKHKKDNNEFETTDAGFIVGSYNPNRNRMLTKEQIKNDILSKSEEDDDRPSILCQTSLNKKEEDNKTSVLGQNSLEDEIFGDIEM